MRVPECYAAACGPVKRTRLFAAVPPSQLMMFALGLVLGPGLGVLSARDITAAAPVLALGCGLAGAAMAARLDSHSLSVPALVSGALGAAGVAVAVGLLLRLSPGTAATLGTATSVALLFAGMAVAPRSALAPVLLAAALALSPARRPPTSAAHWVLLLILAAMLTALAFRTFGPRPETALPPAAAFAAILLGAGMGAAAGVSPLLVCWGAALVLGAASPGRSSLRSLVLNSEGWAVGMLWLAAGTIAAVPNWRLLLIVLTTASVPPLIARAARWVPAASFRSPEPVALALAWAVALVSGRGPDSDAPLLTAAALALLAVQTFPAVPAIMKRLTRGRDPVEVSA